MNDHAPSNRPSSAPDVSSSRAAQLLERLLGSRSARRSAAAVLSAALLFAAALVALSGRGAEAPPRPLTPQQVSALARLAPYAELLASDFDAAIAALPAELIRDVTVSADRLSASGLVALPLEDGTCAAIRIDIGPTYLLDGDLSGVAVSDPALLGAQDCPVSR